MALSSTSAALLSRGLKLLLEAVPLYVITPERVYSVAHHGKQYAERMFFDPECEFVKDPEEPGDGLNSAGPFDNPRQERLEVPSKHDAY
jgi:hypothetical protein